MLAARWCSLTGKHRLIANLTYIDRYRFNLRVYWRVQRSQQLRVAIVCRLLPKLKARGHRVCLFSQFTGTLDIVEDYLNLRRFKYRRLDGSVSRVRRAICISEFQKEGSNIFIFLMTTRAGGLGITLTAADTVVLFDSDWNPQVSLSSHNRDNRFARV